MKPCSWLERARENTRAVVRRVREKGALRGVLTTERSDVDRLTAEAREHPRIRALVTAFAGEIRSVDPASPLPPT